ncbi:MAG: sugar phosphate isomerase/epimerase family protein [Armatimonadota bacterium]|nr:sugar phosphate isomerase/epimerase family protein [Armatimonadota bacterium]
MRWSLMTYTVHAGQPGGLQTLEEMADLARELQFEALELSGRDLAGRTPDEIADVCAAREVAISCINGPADLAASDDAAFASGLVQARALIDAAADMGCPVVMLIPGRAEGPEDKPRAAERIAEGLREAVAYASGRDVTVTIEDFPNPLAPYASIEEVRRLLDGVPGLRLTFDNGNWLVGGDDPVAAAREFADAIANCHVKDWEPDPQQARIRLPSGSWIRGGLHGEGVLDHRAILSALVEIGYDGHLAFEYEGAMDHVEATRRGMEYLRCVLSAVQQEREAGRGGASGV